MFDQKMRCKKIKLVFLKKKKKKKQRNKSIYKNLFQGECQYEFGCVRHDRDRREAS